LILVDRAGLPLVMLRGDGAGLHTPEGADRKAYTARTFGTSSTDFVKRMLNDPASAGSTTTETLKPSSLHLSIAASAIVFAIANGMFFWLTRPCAPAFEDNTTAQPTAPKILKIDGMRHHPPR
jgi:Haem-degrading